MTDALPKLLKEALTEKLAESLAVPLPESTPRRIYGAVRLPGKATAVVGIRRAGKTTFLHQMRRERMTQGAAREHLPYINFEDERLAGLRAAQLGFLLEEYGRRISDAHARGTVAWFFDEIQVVPGWERFVRRLLDAGRTEVIVTGSSAALLSREIATALRGRAWEVPLYPFSFAEALRHQARTIPEDPGFITGPERARIERAFLDWLVIGGFPEAQGLDGASRGQLLRDYVDVAMLRDVVERHGVNNVTGLRWLVRQLLGNAAGLFSVEKFYAALKSQGVAISKDTVHQLLAHLEDCFLVRMVWMESASERQRMVNPRKAYPVDPGLIPVFDRSGRGNIGHALETAVLIELERRRCAVTYVRTPAGYEIDFLARGADGKPELIQVCADASNPETAERELRALIEAGALYPKAHRRLLTLTRDGMPADPPPGITVQPAYEWLLTEPGR
ncbi:MAG: ATP-binding protein [Candidatus Aminicenantes bacterium]|nr:ATP-binding protein [Candidatus Aminicenantes bacterium]